MHIDYYNEKGELVPSVTTILKILDKPKLKNWIWYMGRINKSVESVLESSSYFGTAIHDCIETNLNDGIYIPIYSELLPKAKFETTMNNFNKFKKEHDMRSLAMEISSSCDLYGGTFDFYGLIDGKLTLGDFKTSKTIYNNYLLQLGGYYNLIKDKYDIEQGCIIQVNDKGYSHRVISKDDLIRYSHTFIKLAILYKDLYRDGVIE